MNNSGSGGRANSGPDDDDDVQVGGSRTFPLFGLEDLILLPTSSLVSVLAGGSVPSKKTSQSAYPVSCTVYCPLYQAAQPCMSEDGLEDLILVPPVKLVKAVS